MTNLRLIREKQGVKPTWLAESLGISRSALWRYENGKVPAPRSVLFMAAQLLRVTTEDLNDNDA